MPNSVIRTWLTILGVGLGILWLTGLGSEGSTRTIAWLNFIGALFSFVGAVATTPQTTKQTRAGGTLLLGTGVLAIWLIGLVNAALPAMVWWTFAFACAYLVLGAAAAMPPQQQLQSREEPFTYRRSA